MGDRRVYDDEGHAQFITFSCYKRRKLLSTDRAKKIVIGTLAERLAAQNGSCIGFVVMPDHVHALVWFDRPGQLSRYYEQMEGVEFNPHQTALSPVLSAVS